MSRYCGKYPGCGCGEMCGVPANQPEVTTEQLVAIGQAMAHAAGFKTVHDLFLECVDKTGAYAVYIDNGGKVETIIPKGSTTHGIERHELIEFRPLSRKERRYLEGKRKRLR